jgi:hypothetical protein
MMSWTRSSDWTYKEGIKDLDENFQESRQVESREYGTLRERRSYYDTRVSIQMIRYVRSQFNHDAADRPRRFYLLLPPFHDANKIFCVRHSLLL